VVVEGARVDEGGEQDAARAQDRGREGKHLESTHNEDNTGGDKIDYMSHTRRRRRRRRHRYGDITIEEVVACDTVSEGRKVRGCFTVTLQYLLIVCCDNPVLAK